MNTTKEKKNSKEDTHCVHCGAKFEVYEEIEHEIKPKDEKGARVIRIEKVVHEPGENRYEHMCDEMRPHHVDVSPRYFACRCSGESRAKCEWIMAEALHLLNKGARREVTKENLLTHVVYSLSWDYYAMITGIPNDQWSAVVAETDGWDKNDHTKNEKEFHTYIECDSVEDGIAATWLAYYQHYGERRVMEDDD